MVASLVLLSVSGGLAASGLRAWIVAIAAAGFAIVSWLTPISSTPPAGTCAVTPDGTFNETIHAPQRLRICGLLRSVDELDFAVLLDTLDMSDATLSKHLRVLGDEGFVTIEKASSPLRSDARRITWISLTRAGRRALSEHVRSLRAITEGSGALMREL